MRYSQIKVGIKILLITIDFSGVILYNVEEISGLGTFLPQFEYFKILTGFII